MNKFKDFEKKYMKELSGASVSDAERKKLMDDMPSEYIKEISGATISDAEREKLLSLMPKQKKGGIMKKANGGMVRGQGAAIRGTKFKGIF